MAHHCYIVSCIASIKMNVSSTIQILFDVNKILKFNNESYDMYNLNKMVNYHILSLNIKILYFFNNIAKTLNFKVR